MLRYLPIVYVEPKEHDFHLLETALIETQHQGLVVHLENGAAALDYLKQAKSQDLRLGLVIIDLHLPGISGLQVIQYIRSEQSFSNVPVIAISDRYVYDELDAAYEAGANLFLLKPAEPKGWAEMVFRVQDYFSGSS